MSIPILSLDWWIAETTDEEKRESWETGLALLMDGAPTSWFQWDNNMILTNEGAEGLARKMGWWKDND